MALDVMETQLTVPSIIVDGIGSIGRLLATSKPSFEVRALLFFVTTYIWADILA